MPRCREVSIRHAELTALLSGEPRCLSSSRTTWRRAAGSPAESCGQVCCVWLHWGSVLPRSRVCASRAGRQGKLRLYLCLAAALGDTREGPAGARS